MKNWKTTAAAAVSAIAGFVLFDPQWFPLWVVSAAKYVMLGGLAGLGLLGKDFDSHSTKTDVLLATAKENAKLDQAEEKASLAEKE
jgi:hypothetical protein